MLQAKLEFIWTNAKSCKCENDNEWLQDIKGEIHCEKCNEIIVDTNNNVIDF